MSGKFGDQNYDLGRFMQRGLHELANTLYPESQIPLRDHAGLYSNESRDVEPSQLDREMRPPEPEVDEPDLEM